MFVKSMKGLAGIRDAMWELLTHESTSRSWDVVCRRLLEKPLLLWEDLMQQLFLGRLQVPRAVGFTASPGVICDCLECVLSLLTYFRES